MRLTKWNGKKWVLPQGRTSEGESYFRIIAERLAAYENTGYEPWELPIRQMPKGYDIEVSAGECYHKELWYGFPEELPKRLEEVSAMARNDWGWMDAIITATEWEFRKEN